MRSGGAKHTRQNQTHGQPHKTERRGKGGAKGAGREFDQPIMRVGRYCWCGEQHDTASPDPKYWQAGVHPWPPLDQSEETP